MDKKTLIDTAHLIMEGKITNASFSHMNLKFMDKSSFTVCSSDVDKAIKLGLEMHDEAWIVQEKEAFNEDNFMEYVTEINEGKVDAIVFKESNLVMLSPNYDGFLYDAFCLVNEQEYK